MQLRKRFLVRFVSLVMLSFSSVGAMEGPSMDERDVLKQYYFSPEAQQKVNRFLRGVDKNFFRLSKKEPLKVDGVETGDLFQDISAHWRAISEDVSEKGEGQGFWFSLLVERGIITPEERKKSDDGKYRVLCQELSPLFSAPEDFKPSFKSPLFFLRVIGIKLASFAWMEWRNIQVGQNTGILSSLNTLLEVVEGPYFSSNMNEIPCILNQWEKSKCPEEDKKTPKKMRKKKEEEREEERKVLGAIKVLLPGTECSVFRVESDSRDRLREQIRQSLAAMEQVSSFPAFAFSAHLRVQKLGCFEMAEYFGNLYEVFRDYSDGFLQWCDILSSSDHKNMTPDEIRKAARNLLPAAKIPDFFQGKTSRVSRRCFDAAVEADLGLANGSEKISPWSAWSFCNYIWSCYVEEPQTPYKVSLTELPSIEDCFGLFQCQHFKEQARKAQERMSELEKLLKEQADAHTAQFDRFQRQKEEEIQKLKAQLVEKENRLRRMERDGVLKKIASQIPEDVQALKGVVEGLEREKRELLSQLDAEKKRYQNQAQENKKRETERVRQETENAATTARLRTEWGGEKRTLEEALGQVGEDLQELKRRGEEEKETLQQALAAQKLEYEKQLEACQKRLEEITRSEISLKGQIQRMPPVPTKQEKDQRDVLRVSKILGLSSQGQGLEEYLRDVKGQLEKSRALEESLEEAQQKLQGVHEENTSLKETLERAQQEALAEKRREEENFRKYQEQSRQDQIRLEQRRRESHFQETYYYQEQIQILLRQLSQVSMMPVKGYFPPHIPVIEGNGVRLPNGSWTPLPRGS